jgi:putative ABC transport system permease protein
MGSLITANVKSRPTRTVISIVAVGLGVTLMLVIGGITSGTLNDYLNRTMNVGADFILQPGGASILFAFSGADLPIALAAKVREVPGVGIVSPVLAKFSQKDFGLVLGIDLASYNQFEGRLRIVSGRESLTGDEIIVDELYARTHKLQPGMPLRVLEHDFSVSGICRQGAMVRLFVPLMTLQEVNGTPQKVTMLFIKAAPGVKVDQVSQRLKEVYAGYSLTRTSDPSFLLADTRLPGLPEFRFVVILVSMLMSFMVILLAMYTTIFERTREIGILKSLGASRRFIISMILRESVMISSLGAVFGLGVSEVIRKIITTAFPTLQVSMTVSDVVRGCLLGLLGGTLGALYPAYKAARMDPVKALSYE